MVVAGGEVMSNGLLFYWFSWILWILVTFFMRKNKYRLVLACWLLLLILCSGFQLSLDGFKLSLSYPLILIGALILHTKIPRIYFHVFVSLTIMIGYTGVLIWENQLPLEHFFPPMLIISCFLYILMAAMTTGLWSRLACGLLGMAGGELLYSIIIADFSIPNVIGDKRFLDLMLVLMVVAVCHDSALRLKLKLAKKFRTSAAKSKPFFRKQAQ